MMDLYLFSDFTSGSSEGMVSSGMTTGHTMRSLFALLHVENHMAPALFFFQTSSFWTALFLFHLTAILCKAGLSEGK